MDTEFVGDVDTVSELAKTAVMLSGGCEDLALIGPRLRSRHRGTFYRPLLTRHLAGHPLVAALGVREDGETRRQRSVLLVAFRRRFDTTRISDTLPDYLETIGRHVDTAPLGDWIDQLRADATVRP